MIYTMPRNLPPYDARHVWHMKMDELRFHVNDIVDLCMVHGEHGWPPHSGGNSVVAKGKSSLSVSIVPITQGECQQFEADVLNGPLQIEIFGVPDYADLYERADLDDGGVMTGPTLEMRILEDYMNKARRPGAALEQAASDTSTKPAEPLQCRSCSVHHDCPFEGDYRCVADVKAFTNTRSLQGCCKLDTWSGSPGRRLLRSSPPVAANSANRAGAWGDHSCACNCTYVSPTCCGADDGIVSELPSVEIEALAPPTATTCCDRDTGLFAQGTARLNSTFC